MQRKDDLEPIEIKLAFLLPADEKGARATKEAFSKDDGKKPGKPGKLARLARFFKPFAGIVPKFFPIVLLLFFFAPGSGAGDDVPLPAYNDAPLSSPGSSGETGDAGDGRFRIFTKDGTPMTPEDYFTIKEETVRPSADGEPRVYPESGQELLDFCREASSSEMLEAIDQGADALYANEDGLSCLMTAASSNPDPSVISVLAANGAKPSDREKLYGFDSLMFAAAFNQQSLVTEVLLRFGGDPKAANDEGSTALHLAAAINPSPQVMSSLLNAGSDIEARDRNGATALTLSAGYGRNLLVMKRLLGAKANPEAADIAGRTPLHYAARHNGNPDFARTLAEAGANLEHKDLRGATPIFGAAGNENEDILITLSRLGADPLVRDSGGTSPFFEAGLTNENPKVLEEFLKLGADANGKNDLGLTPLMAAAGNPNPEIVRYLAVQGSEVNAVEPRGRSALMFSAWLNPDPRVSKALLYAGADPFVKDSEGKDALAHADLNPNPLVKRVISDFIEDSKEK
ncbi:MAG: ankyrin repeat domain-containing protein [Deltaproteobacteria bacterium]|jgi:ankyrin repeat protein|nr:ankyrin repeat domain-containing protein [Deltaproteobacteria bacterium]